MRVTHAFLADYANKSVEGKLNVLGIFDSIHAASFPTQQPQLFVVLKFEAGPAEVGLTRSLDVKLLDQDGAEKIAINGALQVPPPPFPGRPSGMDAVIGINGLAFEQPGEYSFAVLINGDEKASIRLYVQPLPAPGSPSSLS